MLKHECRSFHGKKGISRADLKWYQILYTSSATHTFTFIHVHVHTRRRDARPHGRVWVDAAKAALL